jgi:hypothetical protein
MYARQAFLAAALVAAFAATDAGAAPVTMRTVLCYSLGAWVTPAAVVLRNPQEWTLWNESMVAAGRALAAEPVPQGVDWRREILLVVAIGERTTLTTFELEPPRRSGHHLYFTGRIETSCTQSFSSPSHVVALNRRFADSIELDPTIGTLENPCALQRPAVPAGTMADSPSWGAMKHQYR